MMTSRRTLGAATVVGLLLGIGCASPEPREQDWFEGGDLKPASAETLQLTARILAAKGRTEQATALLDRMAREYPDFLGTYTEAAEVYLLEGRINRAVEILDLGLSRFPAQPILLNDRGMCRLLQQDLPRAAADFNRAMELDPSDGDFVGNAALAAALQGNDQRALDLWERVVSPGQARANLAIATKARSSFTMGSDSG